MKAIRLLLTENIDNLGIVGDVVEVRSGYARNFLLPRALATTPTPGNIQRLAARRAVVEQEMKAVRVQLEALLEKLKGHELTVQRSANEQGVLFGGVSQHDIAQALQAEGFNVDDRAVRIGQQIKRLDSYLVPVVLASDLKTEIKLWVVSDKPMEHSPQEEAPAQAPPPGAAAQAETTEGEGKSKGKSKTKAKTEVKTEEPAAGEEKPKRKSRSKKTEAGTASTAEASEPAKSEKA